MKFSTLFSPQLIFLDHKAQTIDEVLSVASKAFAHETGAAVDVIKTKLVHRESLGPTYIDKNVMVPHAYMEELHDCLVLFIRTATEIPVPQTNFRSRYFFVILTSKEFATLYLNILRSISEILSNHFDIAAHSSTAEEFIDRVDSSEIRVQKHLCARDLMSSPSSISENETLSHAVDIMKERGTTHLSVVDEKNGFKGVIEFLDILTTSMPEYSLRLNDLSFLEDFEPIGHFLQHENSVQVKKFLKYDTTMIITEETSFVEVFFLMAKYKHKLLVVTNKSNQPTGIIRTSDIINKAFRA